MEIKFGPDFWKSFDNCFGVWGRFKSWIYDNNPYRNFRIMVQRGTRGYCETDYWSMYSWTGKVILNNLKHFKDSKRYGYKIVNRRDDPYDWERLIDTMIDGWETLVNWDDIDMEIFERHRNNATGPKKKTLFGKKENSLTDKERSAMWKERDDKYKDAQKKAMLFVTHFHSLWD